MESFLERIKDVEAVKELVEDDAFKDFGEKAEKGDGAELGWI